MFVSLLLSLRGGPAGYWARPGRHNVSARWSPLKKPDWWPISLSWPLNTAEENRQLKQKDQIKIVLTLLENSYNFGG